LTRADDDPVAGSLGDLIADRRYGFGRDLASRGDLSAAADLFAQAVEAAPGFVAAWFALGETRSKLGDGAGAAAALREALRIDPRDRHGAALHLARLGAADPAGAMSPSYVRAVFDQYAPRFDTALVEGLAYRGPERLLEAVGRARALSPADGFGAMLDLGCGTGLAGAAFRPQARQLTGVDLSPGMIAQARAKCIYDRLETGELVEFLDAERAARRCYDLVIAADVFVYLFDLAPVARAVADILSPRGLFAFTVETHGGDGTGDGVELGEKLRYRHGAAHVRAAVAAGPLQLLELSPVTTRIESGGIVPGLLAVATRDHSGGLP
jgi:predicted TPR repeat methyltransferase